MLLGGVLALGGCADATGGVERFYDSKLSLDNPIDWWHQLQGGSIASQRPPPPGLSDPYPNLASVPPRPTPTDPAARRALLAQLTAERDRTRQLETQDPIVFPSAAPAAAASPSARPAAATAPLAPAADPDASSMTLDAASAPPAPAAPPPRTVVDAAPPPALAATPAAAVPVTSGPIPALPLAAPSLPVLPGLPISVAQPVVVRPRPGAAFSFAAGSAALPGPAEAALRALATRRAGSPVGVRAGGDARSNSPGAQGAALPLALRRTGAITAALIAAGVPANAIRAEGVAPGREASVRLVD